MKEDTMARINPIPPGVIAAGAYFETIRTALDLSRDAIMVKVVNKGGNIGPNQVYRIERGKIESSATLLAVICDVLGASMDDVKQLLVNPSATREDGVALAKTNLDTRSMTEITILAKSLLAGDAARAAQIILDLQQDPVKLAKLLGYGESLIGGD